MSSLPASNGPAACAEPSATVKPPPREALLLAVNMLPASPQVLARLDPLLANLESSVDEVTELLRRDPALTARIIRIANSVAYNRGEPLASIEEALMRVGFAEVYRVTGFAVLAQVSNQQIPLYDINGAQFRENSLLAALIMESLARAAGLDSRTAYTAGLLRSTGRHNDVEPFARGSLVEWETATFGWNNCEAAAIVLEAWRFPPELIAAVRDHYTCAEGAAPLTHLLNLASGAAERCGHGLPGEFLYWQSAVDHCAAAGIDAAIVDDATRQALETFGPVRAAIA